MLQLEKKVLGNHMTHIPQVAEWTKAKKKTKSQKSHWVSGKGIIRIQAPCPRLQAPASVHWSDAFTFPGS